MGMRRVLAAALLPALLAACTGSEAGPGRDGSGRVLTGTTLDLEDDVTYPEPFVVLGATPWGAVQACPVSDSQMTMHYDGTLSPEPPLPSDGEALGAVWQYLARFDGAARDADLYVVPSGDVPFEGVVVAAPWVEGTREPVAAWFALRGTSVRDARGCASFFG